MRPGQSWVIGWLGQRWTAETGRASRDPAGQWVRTPQRLWLCGRPGRCARGQSPELRLDAPRPGVGPPRQPSPEPRRPLCLSQPACPTVGPASTAESRAPGAACRGGAGARSRGLTSPPGLRGVGATALRLTCSGGGEPGLGLRFCPCAPAAGGGRGEDRPRLPSAVGIQALVATSGPG